MRGVPRAPATADQLRGCDLRFGFSGETWLAIHHFGEYAEWQKGLERHLLNQGEWWGTGEIGKRSLVWDKNIWHLGE